MVMEFLRRGDPKYFTQAERQSLSEQAVPHSELGAHVWLGVYNDNSGRMQSTGSRLSRTSPAVGAGGAYRLLIVLRQLVVQVFVERGSTGQDIYIRPGDWNTYLVQIWPPRRRVKWPPPAVISEGHLESVRNRFLDLSV